MPMAYPPLQKAGCKVFGFDGARNAVHVWDGQADSVRTAYTVRFGSPMPEGMKSQEEYMRNMFLYDVLMGGAWGGDGRRQPRGAALQVGVICGLGFFNGYLCRFFCPYRHGNGFFCVSLHIIIDCGIHKT